jgi:hypothetical protein
LKDEIKRKKERIKKYSIKRRKNWKIDLKRTKEKKKPPPSLFRETLFFKTIFSLIL